jgi:predicted phage tail protein
MSNENKIDKAVEEVTGSKYVQKLFKWVLRFVVIGIAFWVFGGGSSLFIDDGIAIIIGLVAAFIAFFISKPITN